MELDPVLKHGRDYEQVLKHWCDYVHDLAEALYLSHREMYGFTNEWGESVQTGAQYRAVYAADAPDGGIGVSFIDPVSSRCECYKGYFSGHVDKWLDAISNRSDILEVSGSAENALGRLLTAKQIDPFKDLRKEWGYARCEDGEPCGILLVNWSRWHTERDLIYDTPDYDVLDETIVNDYTNRPFNYCYIKCLARDSELREKIDKYHYFTDAERVGVKWGYWSPAYALALYRSLDKHGLLFPAISSYASFLKYHPYDPVVRASETAALRRFQNITIQLDSIGKIHPVSDDDLYED